MITILYSFIFIITITVVLIFAFKAINIPIPKAINVDLLESPLTVEKHRTYFQNSFYQTNDFGIVELYTEGEAYSRGISIGKLLQKIKFEHETEFVQSIESLVPNQKYLYFLKIMVGIFNRNLHKKIDHEFLEEIYGMSHFSSKEFEYIAPNYQRILNYHAAHDIGHALQNFGLVGCSSFVVNHLKSEDNNLLLARNLDFSPSEGFNKRKVLYFINPSKGYKFISYSWPGFIGVVSGMNEHGLCVVLHAAKSKPTLKTGTPVSILAREILQYSKNLEDARQILSKKDAFVSELFLIVAPVDNSAIVFEKTPQSLTEFEMQKDELICTNHYLSDEKSKSLDNIEWKTQISSDYREKRLKELLNQQSKIDIEYAAKILRDVKGLKNADIGLQNENAINQLAAHHGIIFKPNSREFWISTSHYTLGAMLSYQFDEAFEKCKNRKHGFLHRSEFTIDKDEFLNSIEYSNFLKFKKLKTVLKEAISRNTTIKNEVLDEFKNSNNKSFYTFELLGDYFKAQNENVLAKRNYEIALQLNIPTKFDVNRIKKKMKQC